MSRLALYFLGPPVVERDHVSLKIRRRKVTALLAYLAVRGEACTRDALAALFWPEQDRSHARADLRRALSSLKKAVGDGWLNVDRETVGLNPNAEIWLDVREFQNRVAAPHAHDHPQDHACPDCLLLLSEAADLYRDDFLAGFSLSGSPAFDEWQFFQIEGLRQDLARALERLANGYSVKGEFEPAIGYARRWVALDPLHEPAHRCLMRLYAWSGQRAGALRQYGECERVLQEELGESPEEETTQLYEAIQQRRDLPSPLSPGALPAVPPDRMEERYSLGAELARGGMGVVYRGYDTLLERDVAVKVLSEATPEGESRARLLHEAQAAAKLNHPNIVSVYDAGDIGGAPAIVMELVEGEPLGSGGAVVLPDGSDWFWTIDIARQMCAALEHAHAHGIVYRDLKPENVLLVRDPRTGNGVTVKLIDFGLARSMASRVTTEGKIAGTVYYLAPELALGQAYDGRADLYSLGVMLYELTTGRLPFVADDALAVISQHLHAPVVPPRARNAGIPPALDRLIVCLLSKNPEDRPASAAEVMCELDAPNLLDRKAAPTSDRPLLLERIERGRMVGREREMARARALWQGAAAGQGQVLLIGGEPGVGKTRLVRELVTQAQVLGGRAWVGACYAEGGMPYAPFAQILQQALTPDAWESLDLPEFVLADLCMLAPALQLRFPGACAETPTTLGAGSANAGPQDEQHRLFESVALFFAALSGRVPLLLMLEDAHWADSGTVSLLRHLARQMQRSRAMIVATYREVELDEARPLYEALLDLQRERLTTRLQLPRLEREQTREMLAVLFDEEITSEFLSGIYAETEGNPFFVEEVCKALVESGKLQFDGSRWHRPSMEELGVPPSVRVAIQSRLRVLPAKALEVLRLAAVLGREFEFDILAEASDQDEAVLIEALEDAGRAQLIERVGAEGGGTFALAHSLIAGTLIESTRTLQRRQLHRRVAAAIEARRPGDESRLEALAYHYSEAGERERATNYLLQVGDRARRLYAHQEAIQAYERALALLREMGDDERAARTLMTLGLTYHTAFDYRRAREAHEEGFRLWQRAGSTRPPARLSPAPHALRMHWQEPPTLDPALEGNLDSANLIGQLFSGLVAYTPELGIAPDVAASWDVEAGGSRYVFHLRDDAVWSDGVPVRAGDFEYAWRRVLDPATGSGMASMLYDVKGARAFHEGLGDDLGVRALDDRTLAIELEGPTGYFLHLVAVCTTYPVPRHVVEVRGSSWAEPGSLVGNGAFTVASWQPGQTLVLRRNPHYRGPASGNLLEVQLTLLQTREPSTKIEAYEAGLSDVLDFTFEGTELMDRVRTLHAEEYVSLPTAAVHFGSFEVIQPPFSDARVRRAFALALDRERLADVAWQGRFLLPATGGLVLPGLPGFAPGLTLPYNPGQAQELLAEAGCPGGAGIPVLEMVAYPPDSGIWDPVVGQWRDNLGVEVHWHSLPWAAYLERLRSNPPPISFWGWVADYPDPDNFLRVAVQAFTDWRDHRYFEIVEQARRSLDQEERMALYAQAQRILAEEVPVLPLGYRSSHLLIKPWVRRYPVSAIDRVFWKDVVLEPH